MWPSFFNKNLIIGTPKNPVAICTLWSKKEYFAEKLKGCDYNLIGNLYTADGINYLLKNILANPVISHLIICGQDFFHSGAALVNFFDKGIDENRKIIDAEAYIHSNIPLTAIAVIRKNVKVIDLRGKEDELLQVIGNISRESKPFMEPIVLPDEIAKQDVLTTQMSGFRVEGSLAEVWLKILDLTNKFGEVKESEHELKQKELLDVLAVINEFSLKPFLGLKEGDAKKYIDLFFSENPPKDVEYTYGKRLFRFAFEHVSDKFSIEFKFFINQIDKVVNLLKKSPYSRRAVAVLWNPFIDADSSNPPCLTQITWNIKNKKLYQTCVFRSHDLFGAYPLNALALRGLQERIADEVGVPAGDLIMISQSAHVYENSWEKINNILDENYRNREMEFVEDSAGFFRIAVDGEKKEIVARHFLNDGRPSSYEFRGTEAASLYRRIFNENLVSRVDHAAYLGRELTRAEECLKNNKEYDQESLSG